MPKHEIRSKLPFTGLPAGLRSCLWKVLFRGILLGSLVLAVAGTGCGSRGAAEPPEGSAVWVEPDSAPLEPGTLVDLEAAGAGHLFAPFGTLSWEGDRPSVDQGKPLPVPRRTPVMVVVEGPWKRGVSSETAGQALTEELRRLALEAEAAGVVPAGFHLELEPGSAGDLAGLGAALAAARETLPRTFLLSVGIQREWVGRAGLQAVTDAVDSFVAWVYGQRPEELRRRGWVDEAWDLQQVDLALRSLETLGRDYLVGVVTLGTTVHLGASGGVKGLHHEGSLRRLVRDPALRLEHGFVLSGMDCRRYEFRAVANGKLGDWDLRRGDRVLAFTLGPSRVRDYRLLLPALDLSHRLGDLFYRLPKADDPLSVGTAGLLEALSPEPPEAILVGGLEEVRRSGEGVVLRARVGNPGEEATEVAVVDVNYLQLETSQGRFGAVSLGQFQRYQTLRRDPGGELRPSLRNATVLRLFEPVLEPGQTVTSGEVEVLGAGGAGDVRWSVLYLAGDGGEITEGIPEAPASEEEGGEPEK